MLTLYYLENSRAFRVEWLLNELSLEHETKIYKRVNGKRAGPELAKESGFMLGKSPALRDSDGDVFIVESSAILQYLVDRYDPEGKFTAKTSSWQDRADLNSWLSYSEGTTMIHVLPMVYAHWFIPDSASKVRDEFATSLERNIVNDLNFVEESLAKNFEKYGKKNGEGAFLVGDKLTIADVQMAFSVEYTLTNGMFNLNGKWKNVEAWLLGLEARPAYKKTLEVAEYKYVLANKQ